MSHKRQVWETFSQLAQRLLVAAETSALPPQVGEVDRTDLDEMSREVKRLGKAQFKANALQEVALDQLRQALGQLSAQDQETRQKVQADATHDLLIALVPILDGLEAALDSGARLLTQPNPGTRDERWAARRLDGGNRNSGAKKDEGGEDAARLVLRSDRALMAAWLEGLRLVRERLLDLLADAGVEPIPTIGQPFDPYLHQAVGTAGDSAYPPGVIVVEQRRGYTGPAGVLRYAEVIVNRKDGDSGPESRVPNPRIPEDSL